RFVLASALALFAGALACFPMIRSVDAVYTYAIVLAAAGGAITVCFFTIWRQAFGTEQLGRIQGAAQLLTVVFSALGPLLFASVKTRFGNYSTLFPILAAVAASLAILSWFARSPRNGVAAKKEGIA